MKLYVPPAWCFALILLSSGCQQVCRNHCPTSPVRSFDYDYFYEDRPNERRLELTLVSKSKRRLCIGREKWPNVNGKMDTSSYNGTYLFVASRIYAFKDSEYQGYCSAESCFHPLEEGEKAESYLNYVDFGLPEDSYDLPKELKYKPEPFWCNRGRFSSK